MMQIAKSLNCALLILTKRVKNVEGFYLKKKTLGRYRNVQTD